MFGGDGAITLPMRSCGHRNILNGPYDLDEQGVTLTEIVDDILAKTAVLLQRQIHSLEVLEFGGSVVLGDGQHILPID